MASFNVLCYVIGQSVLLCYLKLHLQLLLRLHITICLFFVFYVLIEILLLWQSNMTMCFKLCSVIAPLIQGDRCNKKKKYIYIYWLCMGTTVAQWLRCCATNWKVAGSILDGVIGIFHWHNPSDHTVALGLTQPLTEMSTRSISWG